MIKLDPIPPYEVMIEYEDADDDVSLPCQICFKGFSNYGALMNHCRNQHESLPCQICFKIFSNDTALVNHCKNEHSGTLKSDTKPNDFNKHPQKTKTPAKLSPTKRKVNVNAEEEAQRKREFLSTLKSASLVSLASEDVSYVIFPCKDEDMQGLDSKSGRTKRGYTKKEKEIAPVAGPFECLQPSTFVEDGTCHQVFFSCCEYSVHFREEHTKRHKGKRCQVCEKPLLPGVADDPESIYSCQICGEPHDDNKSLQEHINTAHQKLRPFKCSVCLKRFTQKGGLMQHMRLHTGERPYCCTLCPRTFTQKSGLEQHLRTHTNHKPYRCVVCNKTFAQSTNLKQHMRNHTNLTPLQCGICERRFKQSTHLKYHLKSHSEEVLTDEQRAKLAAMLRSDEDNAGHSLEASAEAGEDSTEVIIEYVI